MIFRSLGMDSSSISSTTVGLLPGGRFFFPLVPFPDDGFFPCLWDLFLLLPMEGPLGMEMTMRTMKNAMDAMR